MDAWPHLLHRAFHWGGEAGVLLALCWNWILGQSPLEALVSLLGCALVADFGGELLPKWRKVA